MDQGGLAAGGQMAEQGGQGDPAGAEPDRVHRVAAGYVGRHLDGLFGRRHVGVEIPVPLLGGRVAPAEGEVGDAGGHGGFHQAATWRQVGDVVLVDLRRDGHQRAVVDLRGGLLVLDQLEDLAAVDDLTGCGGQVAPDREGAGVHLGRHAAVVAEVVGEVAGAGQETLAAGLGRLGQGVGVGEQVVGGRQGLGHQ